MEYYNWLKSYNIDVRNVLKLSRRINTHLEMNSNSYLYLRRIEVGSTVRYEMRVEHFKHVIYRKSEDIGQEFVIISKFLNDEQKLNKFPPKILPVTLNGQDIVWQPAGNGVEEAIIHFKKEDQDGESDFYSRSDLIAILSWLYVDYQVGNLNSKIAATELITKKLLAFQAPDPSTLDLDDDEDETDVLEQIGDNGRVGVRKEKDPFRRNMMQIKRLVTNLATHPTNLMDGGAAAAIAGVEYPYSGVAPEAIDLEMNRDTKHQEFQLDKAVANICMVMGWSPELLMYRQTKTNMGGNLLYDIFTVKNESTVRPRANTFEDFWNGIFDQIKARESAPSQFDQYGIQFPDVIQEMIDKFKGSGTSTNIGENPVRDGADINPDDNGQNPDDDGAGGEA